LKNNKDFAQKLISMQRPLDVKNMIKFLKLKVSDNTVFPKTRYWVSSCKKCTVLVLLSEINKNSLKIIKAKSFWFDGSYLLCLMIMSHAVIIIIMTDDK
jgi:hypothetical protein